MSKRHKLNVLVACESSATVRDEFRKLGHNAWSCDLLPCDGDPRYHIQGDALAAIIDPTYWGAPSKWDLMIGHPPCTYLCNSGVRWLFANTTYDRRRNCFIKLVNRGGVKKGIFKGLGFSAPVDMTRWKQMQAAAAFFVRLGSADIPYIALENPIMHKYAREQIGGLRPTQIIQPWQFGHGETKATGLFLKNLPKLVPTNIVAGRQHRVHMMSPGPNRWKERSKTFVGIAQAMAQQWSAHILAEKQKGK